MNKKHRELNARHIMQGLEELATFISYRSNYDGLRILSVTSQQQEIETPPATAQILAFGPTADPVSDYWTKRTG